MGYLLLHDFSSHCQLHSNELAKPQFDDPRVIKRPATKDSQTLSQPQFQCTFCLMKLSQKAWKRHEETQHLPLRKWICMPNNLPYRNESADWTCLFCHNPFYEDHPTYCERGIQQCQGRSLDERTFLRADHLVQHGKTVHKAELNRDDLRAWMMKSPLKQQEWGCGFCGERLKTWKVRATHIAAHFRTGMDMSMWSDDRCHPP